MTTLKVNNGGYTSMIQIDMPVEEINRLCEMCTDGHTVVWSPKLFGRGHDAKGRYNAELDQCEYIGGKIYLGWGPALGWETALLIDGTCKLFEVVA